VAKLGYVGYIRVSFSPRGLTQSTVRGRGAAGFLAGIFSHGSDSTGPSTGSGTCVYVGQYRQRCIDIWVYIDIDR